MALDQQGALLKMGGIVSQHHLTGQPRWSGLSWVIGISSRKWGRAPVLATLGLHQGLEAWCEQAVQPRLQGRGLLSRLADDCGSGGALAGEARRSRAGLPTRKARWGLRLPPPPTALSACRKPEAPQGSDAGNGTCAWLGRTHAWSRSHWGCGGIKRRTARQRRGRPKKSLGRWGHSYRHAPLPYQDPQ